VTWFSQSGLERSGQRFSGMASPQRSGEEVGAPLTDLSNRTPLRVPIRSEAVGHATRSRATPGLDQSEGRSPAAWCANLRLGLSAQPEQLILADEIEKPRL